MAFPSIKIQIGADTTRLSRDLKKGEGIVNSFGKVAKGAMLGVATAAAGAAIAIGVDGVRAAIEDEAAQAKLAKTLENVVGASKDQVKQVEAYIEKTTLATGITDDQLRPSLDRLVRSTKDVTKAQQLQQIALDVSAGTGKDLRAVTEAIAKAYDGNFGALKRLGVPLDQATIKSKNFNKVQESLAKTFSGQLDASLDTQAGKLRVLSTRFDEMKESIGFVLLDGLQPLMDWASGPEGQKFLKDFMEAFKEAALAVAKALPTILEGLKSIGKAASGMGLDFTSFMSPEFLAAGAAFVATPGPIQLKGLAAIAAYYAAKDANMKQSERQVRKSSNALAGSQITGGGYMYAAESDSFVDWTGRRRSRQEIAGLQAGLTRAQNMQSVVNVIVNGVTDPAQAAKNVSRALNKAQRMGINTLAVGTGS